VLDAPKAALFPADRWLPNTSEEEVISDKILVPVDGSEVGDRAVHFAADLASGYAAEVIVTQVCEQECLYRVGVSFEEFDGTRELVDRHVRSRCRSSRSEPDPASVSAGSIAFEARTNWMRFLPHS
jgi:nucleotide-binding universal stress UspA family protein